jgi:5-methyltetrahydrofolate--homocysteine methyltransferase
MSNKKEVLDSLAKAILLSDSPALKKALDEAMSSELPVDVIIREGLGKGMEKVGEKYESGEYFLSELIMSAVVMNEAMERLKPILKKSGSVDYEHVILIGTVEGDLHDIGKNIVKQVLESGGYHVIDLGVDAPPEKFVEMTSGTKPAIVCMSALLSVVTPKVRETIEALCNAGLRDNVKILVGGRSLSQEAAQEMGADAYGIDGFDGLKKAKDLLRP